MAKKKAATPKKKAATPKKKAATPKKKAATPKKKAAAPKKKAATPKKKAAAPKKKAAAPKKKATAPKKKATAPKKKAATPKKKARRKANPSFMRPLQPDSALGAIVGAKSLPRTQVVKKLWAYIKKNELQDTQNRRMINADNKLREVFDGKKQVNMFEMTKLVNKHLQ